MSEPRIKLVKIPAHLIPLFSSQEGILGYATNYSVPILKFWLGVKKVSLATVGYSQLIQELDNWQRVDKVTSIHEFSVQGDNISLWPAGYEHPVRTSFFGEEFEQAQMFDEVYGRKLSTIENLWISDSLPQEQFDLQQLTIAGTEANSNQIIIFSQYLPPKAGDLFENVEVIETDYAFPQLFHGRSDILEKELDRFASLGYQVAIHTRHTAELPTALKPFAGADALHHVSAALKISDDILKSLPAGCESVQQKILFLTDREIFGTIHLTPANSQQELSNKVEKVLRQLEADIEIGDYIVHEDYGVGIYQGLTQEKSGNQLAEYLLLEYAAADQLFVPINQITKLSKYISDGIGEPKLTRLGKKEWEQVKKKVKNSIGVLAREMVEHYARRHIANAPAIPLTDSDQYEEFANEFPYSLTVDQDRTINEVLGDMAKTEPMNRLIVGDVGFGKTEVMMRAAFKMCELGFQVAVLAPTTILTAQHYAVFKDRFQNTPYTIDSVSRFNTAKENQKIADRINQGDIDIVVGTHRLLSSDIKFKKLGLLIIDEEQKFGVKQKEKIKKLNYGVHELMVTATPIPRTLSMALSTIQDISIISTPPENRKSIETKLVKDDWNEISKAITTEVNRGGQVYFVHNRVQTIQSIVAKLERLLPGISFVYAHGQMPPAKLDKIMTDFYAGKYQVLVATTIIENGLDMPNVNTMIINQATRFGLAQLYQLRGRIGRSDKQAYCYLFYQGQDLNEYISQQKQKDDDKVKPKVYMERLQTILSATDLGSSFKIASRDLEIRGAGNLLGDQQTGHINNIGYSLYMQLLGQEIEKLKAGIERQGIVSF